MEVSKERKSGDETTNDSSTQATTQTRLRCRAAEVRAGGHTLSQLKEAQAQAPTTLPFRTDWTDGMLSSTYTKHVESPDLHYMLGPAPLGQFAAPAATYQQPTGSTEPSTSTRVTTAAT
jgi:hypothetical protein